VENTQTTLWQATMDAQARELDHLRYKLSAYERWYVEMGEVIKVLTLACLKKKAITNREERKLREQLGELVRQRQVMIALDGIEAMVTDPPAVDQVVTADGVLIEAGQLAAQVLRSHKAAREAAQAIETEQVDLSDAAWRKVGEDAP
jgi:hypothetical protein